jgi:hypothetical protein
MEFIVGYCAGCMMSFALTWMFFGRSQEDQDQSKCDKRLDQIELE